MIVLQVVLQLFSYGKKKKNLINSFKSTNIIIYSLEFYTSALAVGLPLEFEWQQVSTSLQDACQYSGRSQ